MAKYWQIRESYGNRETGMNEDYECGYEDGYRDAMREVREHEEMGERSYRGGMNGRPNSYVEGEDRGMLGERRGRGTMGRYR